MRFDDKLRLICCNGIPTGKAEGRAAGTREGQVVRAIAGDQRGNIYARPLSTTDRTRRAQCTSKGRSIVVVDGHLSPGIV